MHGAGGVVYAAAPQERGAYAVATPKGRYNYGYNTGDGIAKVEVRQPDGSIVGSYRYFDPTGKQVSESKCGYIGETFVVLDEMMDYKSFQILTHR